MAKPTEPRKPALTPFRTFTNREGRTFAVRVIPRDARHGRANRGLNNGPTLVEFYDTTWADDGNGDYSDIPDGFGPMGQFVTSSYVGTLLGIDGCGSGTGAMDLMGGVPAWRIDAETAAEIRAWLTGYADPSDPLVQSGGPQLATD